MRIVIIYATTEGQTRKIAQFAEDTLTETGHEVDLFKAGQTGGVDPARYDAAILAGSLHAGRYQPELHDFARANAAALNGLGQTLFLPVSLSAAGDDADDLEGLERQTKAFLEETGWTPGEIANVAGAFRFSEYDFFKSLAMRWIARSRPEKIDPHTDTEFTDWDALRAVLADWAPAVADAG